jgi:hypothetical protein
VPDDHEGIERNRTVQVNIHPDREYEKEGTQEQDQREVILQLSFKKKDKSAARPESKEGYADDEISEMVPVLYGEHFDQEDLVGDKSGRYQED